MSAGPAQTASKHFGARYYVSRWDVLGVNGRATAITARDFLDDLLARTPFRGAGGPWQNSPRSDDHSGWSQRLEPGGALRRLDDQQQQSTEPPRGCHHDHAERVATGQIG